MSRPPNYEFQEWWNKQRANDHADDDPLSSSTSDDFRLLTVNIHSPTSSVDAAAAEKDISRSARQLSWIYFLKLHQIAHMLGFITNGFVSLIRTANRRISTASGGRRSESKFYKIIKFFLVLSVCLLVFELVVYFRGRHFSPPSLEAGVEDSVEYIYAKWLVVRANYLAPMLLSLTNVCIVLFLILSLGRFVSLLGCFCIKLGGLKPVSEMNYKKGAENKGVNAEDYPMVLVQIPMCNEREGVEGDDNGDAKRLKPAESGKNETKTEEEDAKGGSNDESEKQKGNQKPREPPKDYIHVRARRGQATDSHSLAERVRREKISERMKLLQDLVPGCNKVTGKALMLDEIINYIQSLQRQVEFLTMKFASVNPSLDFNMENLLSKDMFQPNATMPHHMYPLDSSAPAFNHHQPRQNIQQNNANISSWPLSQCPVDPLTLDAPLCGRNLGIELPSVDGFSNSLPQFPAFTEDDPHSIVQMGFVQNPVDFPVQNQTANKKFEQ